MNVNFSPLRRAIALFYWATRVVQSAALLLGGLVELE